MNQQPSEKFASEKIQVLHARVMAGTGGGPEKTILRSARYAKQTPYELTAAYLHPKNDPGINTIRNRAIDRACPLINFGETHALDTRPLKKLIRFCTEKRVAVWHGHDYKSNLYGLLVRRHHPMKLVSTAHLWTDETLRLRLYKKIDQRCLRYYDEVIAVSAPIAKQCSQHGVPSDRVTMIPNGIELSEFTRKQETNHAKLMIDIPADRVVVGFSGRLSVQKQLDIFLARTASNLVANDPRVLFLLLGDGPQRGKLERIVTEKGLKDHVRFAGWQTDLRPHYEAMDLLVQPSRDEGLPNSVLEAMAMKVPVAATAVGSVPELLNDGNCGILMNPKTPDQWAWDIMPLITDVTLRKNLAATAHAHLANEYSFERRMERVFKLYDRVTQHRSASDTLRLAA